ncbi:arylsulfatase [Rhabdobacter roseus]|uniref:Arylsulfatase A-like enzyme n=1 Tax=Rhabdobacter roseus TaxID=1655419 RepID=A0A840TVY2_9BACT|nr:arylsulfatase [Rhabdobacter roseus]MBB5285767.1 arylsulfatase A-like enzyme [Rhabdobacter roseus]
MKKYSQVLPVLLLLLGVAGFIKRPPSTSAAEPAASKPNIVLIYVDDLGYGDLSCYGASQFKTPNIDRLAQRGLRFTNAHAVSSTCTPSRYALMTGEYPWRRKGTGIATGDATLIIPTHYTTLPSILQRAGYTTGVVGKWHLGLGPQTGADWNADVKPGPLEIGFNYSFLIPATGDRVPCVYVENHRVVHLDPTDPIQVSFKEKIGNEPTGRENPELLKMKPSHGHDMTIVNGISRIGYMTGGKQARWIDEDMADVITTKAKAFMETNRAQPFFLYFSTHDIHVPRVPHSRFAGKSGLGPRGDVILQLDYCVGEITRKLDELGLTNNTLILFSSDNGPVVDDGYHDQAVERLGSHKPAGTLRGGKYSAFEAGTRVPTLACWPGQIKPGVSEALVSQIDWAASLAALTGQKLEAQEVPDSRNMIDTWLGKSRQGRSYVVEHGGAMAIVQGNWKYISPSNGIKFEPNVRIELGNDPEPQLYNLTDKPQERTNRAQENPAKVKELAELLQAVREKPQPR